MGSSPIAHASTTESDCVRQGMAGVFEVFADTIVICTLTGLTLLVSGVMGTGEPTTALNAASLSDAFGSTGGAVIIAVSITLFAFSSLLSWGYYGARCCEFMFGLRSLSSYRLLFCAAALVGAVVRLDAVWLAADVLNAMMGSAEPDSACGSLRHCQGRNTEIFRKAWQITCLYGAMCYN